MLTSLKLKINFLIYSLFETTSKRKLTRLARPKLIMKSLEEEMTFKNMGQAGGEICFTELYNAGQISQVIQGCKHVIDLGCGSASQLLHVAKINPHILFTGYDISAKNIAIAKDNARKLGLLNVNFVKANITKLPFIKDKSIDGIISTRAIHKLDSIAAVKDCFKEIYRILKPGGALYIYDFTLLKKQKTIDMLVNLNPEQSDVFRRDYKYGLEAAFTGKEIAKLYEEEIPKHAKFYSPQFFGAIFIIKTPDQRLPTFAQKSLSKQIHHLSIYAKLMLKETKLLFRLSGVKSANLNLRGENEDVLVKARHTVLSQESTNVNDELEQ